MNISKTELIVFSQTEHITTSLLGQTIQSKDKARFLGVIIDQNLNFHSHVNHIIQKINSHLSTVYHIRDYLCINTKYTYYFAYIHCHILNGAWFLQRARKTDIYRLAIAHKRIIKILFKKSKLTPTKTLYKDLRILSVENIIKLECITQSHRIFYSLSPPALQNYFTKSARSNRFLLRHSLDKNCSTNTFAQLFNELPEEIRDISNPHYFKSKVKNHFMND